VRAFVFCVRELWGKSPGEEVIYIKGKKKRNGKDKEKGT
jgi:hypothetical protein